MKEILLVPGPALSSKIEIEVMDFPNGIPQDLDASTDLIAAARKRCKITVEYGRPDVLELKSQGKDLDAALAYYNTYIYNLVKFHILSDWTPTSGLDEIMSILREKLEPYFE